MIARTPKPPYYAVIFSSRRTGADEPGYQAMAQLMDAMAARQPGYLGVESARDGLGITVSYWRDLESIRAWKADTEHQMAQRIGRTTWYADYCVRIAKVERDYSLDDAFASAPPPTR